MTAATAIAASLSGAAGQASAAFTVRATVQFEGAVSAKPLSASTGTGLDDYEGVSLTPSGTRGTDSDGQVIENLDVTGYINVTDNNVTIRNCRIDAGLATSYCIKIANDVTGTVIEHCELIGSDSASIYGKRFTARYNHIHHHGSDGIKFTGPATIEYNYIHHLGMNASSHADGIQTGGMSPTGDTYIRFNNIDLPKAADGGQLSEEGQTYRHNAAIMLQPETNTSPPPAIWPIDGVVIEGNWLNGGNYTIYVTDQDGVEYCTNVSVIANYFGRNYSNGIVVWKNPSETNVWGGSGEDNYWEDTNTVLTLEEAS
jgi:hypothetical protein